MQRIPLLPISLAHEGSVRAFGFPVLMHGRASLRESAFNAKHALCRKVSSDCPHRKYIFDLYLVGLLE